MPRTTAVESGRDDATIAAAVTGSDAWLLSFDAITSTGLLIGSVVFWRWWSKTRNEPSEITKTGLGFLMSIAGVAALAIGSYVAERNGTKVSLGFLVAFHFLNSIGFSNAFPAALALYARLSPPALAATMMGVFYLQFFGASNLAGYLGGYLEKMPGSQFWGLHAAIVGFAGIVVLVVRQFLRPHAACERRGAGLMVKDTSSSGGRVAAGGARGRLDRQRRGGEEPALRP